jgi:hypothetical protein
MSELTGEERFRRWNWPWKERICDDVRSFSHGAVFRSARYPDYWEYNCIRLDRPMAAGEMIAVADRELAGCAHRLVEWMVPMPDGVVAELRATRLPGGRRDRGGDPAAHALIPCQRPRVMRRQLRVCRVG